MEVADGVRSSGPVGRTGRRRRRKYACNGGGRLPHTAPCLPTGWCPAFPSLAGGKKEGGQVRAPARPPPFPPRVSAGRFSPTRFRREAGTRGKCARLRLAAAAAPAPSQRRACLRLRSLSVWNQLLLRPFPRRIPVRVLQPLAGSFFFLFCIAADKVLAASPALPGREGPGAERARERERHAHAQSRRGARPARGVYAAGRRGSPALAAGASPLLRPTPSLPRSSPPEPRRRVRRAMNRRWGGRGARGGLGC